MFVPIVIKLSSAMREKFIKIQKQSEIFITIDKLLTIEHLLDLALDEISKLKRGKVNPKDTLI